MTLRQYDQQSPQNVIKAAIDRFAAGPAESRKVIQSAVYQVQRDDRLSSPSERVNCLATVVQALIDEFPGKGYERWMPPQEGFNGTAEWADIAKSVKDPIRSAGVE